MNNNPYSAGIDFRRQIMTSKADPRTVEVNTSMMGWKFFNVVNFENLLLMKLYPTDPE